MRTAIWVSTAVALVTADAYANRAPVVSNMHARQQAGTMLVDITHDVYDTDRDTLTVSVQKKSDDGGRTSRVPATSFSGDLGSEVMSVAEMQIVWDAGADLPDRYGTDFRPKVMADDGQLSGSSCRTRTFSLPGGAEMEFVWIAPGTFMMGSPESEVGRWNGEGPQHEVTITKGFWLGKYEVTQGQWESVMETEPWSGRYYVQSDPSHPAVYISWNDVQRLIGKLNQAAGSEVYRLPTEAEWEYACRAGTSTRWSFGDDESRLGAYAWFCDNAWEAGLHYAQRVGTKLPNPWGLYDMHGNVSEWVQDWYGSYTSGSQTDPKGPLSGSDHVERGGGFINHARNTRSAYRNYYLPGGRSNCVGARLLRTR